MYQSLTDMRVRDVFLVILMRIMFFFSQLIHCRLMFADVEIYFIYIHPFCGQDYRERENSLFTERNFDFIPLTFFMILGSF
jgi:hypothetical protein